MTCPYCHRIFIADMAGMNPHPIKFFEVEDEDSEFWIVHEHCAQEISRAAEKIKSERKRQQYYVNLLKKMSN